MKRRVVLTVLVVVSSGVRLHGQVLEVPMDNGWQAVPDWAPFEKADKHDYRYSDGFASFRATGGGRVMIWARNPSPRLDVKSMRYVSLRYRLFNTDPALYSYLLYLDSGDSGGMYAHNLAFGANDLLHDGQWHTATTTLHPFGEIGTLALRFRALEAKEGGLDVAYLRFSSEPPRHPLKEELDWQPGVAGLAGQTVSLEKLRQGSMPEVQQALALSDWFTSEKVVVNGVNFEVPLTGQVAVSTSAKDKQRVAVPVGKKTGALYLLMGASFPYKMLGYEGWVPGDMTERPEQFHVTVRYAEGSEEEQVPFCLAKKQYGLWRGLQTYAMPVVANKGVREIELWDGMVTSSFHLVAVTAAAESLVPPEPEGAMHTPAGEAHTATKPSLKLEGERLTVRSGSGELQFDLSRGLSLLAATNACHRNWAVRVEAVPLFSLKEQGKVWTSESFRRNGSAKTSGTKVETSFTSLEARAAVELTIEVLPDETSFGLRMKNLADQPRTVDLTFPQVRVAHRSSEDLWYFYPTMCPAWSNAHQAFDTAYSGSFPVQFEDVYDRANGGGLYVGTRDTSLRQRYFQLAKAQGAVTMRVEYRFNPPLPPGEWVEYPPTVLGLHGGDWKPAFESYRRWFRTWYKPQHPRLDWYQRVWNFRTWWTHTMGDGRPDWNLFNLKTSEYQAERFLRRDRELYGQVDMIHFFDWRISTKYGAYGDFSHYDDIGGLEKFRGMITYLQDHSVRAGLYLDCYLCSRKSLVGQKHGEEWALRRQDGKLGDNYSTPEDPMLNMCVLHPRWQDYLAETCARVARESGCDGVYLDEGMTDYRAYWCWSKDHGHPVPGTNQAGLLQLARKVRTALSDRVALYTEWSPPDVLIPHLDGAYQAALGRSDVHLSPGFLQLSRFAFPDFKVFTISNAGHMHDGIWEGTKYNLFNGVSLYSLSWGHEEECLPLFRKMDRILHEHQEAFLTRNPQPYVDTERHDLYCNEFPGTRETVWTFWNGRYRTVTGPVLKVKHVRGARYLDLWNGNGLQPAVEKGMAALAIQIGPRGIGAVAQERVQ